MIKFLFGLLPIVLIIGVYTIYQWYRILNDFIDDHENHS